MPFKVTVTLSAVGFSPYNLLSFFNILVANFLVSATRFPALRLSLLLSPVHLFALLSFLLYGSIWCFACFLLPVPYENTPIPQSTAMCSPFGE